jgi:putative Holliday junction resolvase
VPRDETSQRLRVARLPWTTDINPYQGALYGELATLDVMCVATGNLTTDWLVTSRPRIDVLHIHWHLERLADDAPLDSPPAAWVCGQLELARALGYAIAWTVHESGRLLLGRGWQRAHVGGGRLTLGDGRGVQRLGDRRERRQQRRAHAAQRRISALVVGLPLDASQQPTAQALHCRRYGERLARTLELPLAFVNEYASSWAAAERHGLQGDRSGALDSAAAAMLLEQWLAEGPEPAPVPAATPVLGPGEGAQAS